ncbi:GGDEF/EAL domain-containing response regulator [Trichloromonas sp.]|uniref:GGDEF/EAL domain-containing response regulator n=1 Tax=Trichloromonas sp. TaxID=3069249 RepID=UPI003D81AE48
MIISDENTHQLKRATIMIVDDEPINIEVVQAFLEDDDYCNFTCVDDSTQAMRILEESRPDLLLLDLMMPDVSGFDILDSVRKHPKFKHLPVIILTAATDTESKLRALGLGATDFLAKPLDQSELVLRVRNTLGAKAYQDQLAYYDPLTKLPNRQLFLEDLSWALKGAKRYSEPLALLNIEIDKFDKINDTIGLSAGDEVLLIVSKRIQKMIREADLLGVSVDDEDAALNLFHLDSSIFSLILDRIPGLERAAQVAERIVQSIREPMQVEGRDIYLTASIGIATYPTDSDDPSVLMRLASSAKDFVKKSGGNAFQFSSVSINEMYEKRLALETRLRQALETNQFELYYQPKVDTASGVIKGVEALIRWNSPEGMIYPDAFIPLAEETGLIIHIGRWVLTRACRQLRLWQEAGAPISMSVNLSARQFSDPEYMELLKRLILESGVDTSFLTLELTESLLLDDIDKKIRLLHDLKSLGVKLSIDDFGTGFSSLNYLRRLPVDELKIDRSFVMEIDGSDDSRAIVAIVVFLAQSLGLSTVAAGVEKIEELEFLQKLGCEQYQGFYFSRAVTADKLTEMLISPVRGSSQGCEVCL